MYKIRKYNKGFTLIEIIVSIALFSIIAIAFFPGIQYSLKNLFTSNKFMENNYNIQSELESFLGTEVTSESAVETSLAIDWVTTTTVPAFVVSGSSININSNVNYLDEDFEVFIPKNIE